MKNKILFNANIIYFIFVFIAIIITFILNYPINVDNGIEIIGTFIQIALPCYTLVPILKKRDLQGAKQMCMLLVFVLTITYILKYSINAKRPYGGTLSFPSGHTAGAFIGAVFLSYRYGKKYMALAMPLAIFVGFSRVYSNNHWPIDVFASIVICFLLGIFIVKKYNTN